MQANSKRADANVSSFSRSGEEEIEKEGKRETTIGSRERKIRQKEKQMEEKAGNMQSLESRTGISDCETYTQTEPGTRGSRVRLLISSASQAFTSAPLHPQPIHCLSCSGSSPSSSYTAARIEIRSCVCTTEQMQSGL